MQAEINSDAALTAANALLAHLRKNPEAARNKPSVLANEFGLDEKFVASVLQHVRDTPRQEVAKQVDEGPGFFEIVWTGFSRAWEGVTSKPVLFVIVTFLICLALGVLASNFEASVSTRPTEINVGPGTNPSSRTVVTGSTGASGVWIALFIVGTFFLHMAVYYRHRSARHALYGGLFLWLSLTTLIAGVTLTRPESVRGATPMIALAFGSLGMLMLSLVYAGCGSLAAVVGGYVHIRKKERSEDAMSRQELLERYFELQERLQTTAYPRAHEGGAGFINHPFINMYREHPFLPNLVIGFSLSALGLVGATAARIDPNSRTGPELNVWLFGLMLIGIAQFLIFILQGFIARNGFRVILGALCLHAGAWIVRLIALALDTWGPALGIKIDLPSEFDSGLFSNPTFWIGDVADLAFMTGVSFAGYMGARVQNRALREHNLARNDQATLLGEMVRIQWRLANEAGLVCVMVVDAARSSEMKADADPLLVEYTFREYQEWIERICGERGGRVHSTAGDGAVVAFSTCADALACARRLQTDIYRFNKDENRLAHPFRLRIGLHTGEVAGDIGQVQFSEVIDIAAHMEGAAPVGGITVSDTVAERLPDENLIDLNQTMDGHRILMVANPNE